MKIREMTSIDDPLFCQLLDLLHKEFPPETRESDERITQELNLEYRLLFQYHIVEVDSCLAGFIRSVLLEETNAFFIIHLAVDEGMRNRGYGKQLVNKVQRRVDSLPILMEVEEKVFPWWERLGAKILTKTYTQPSLDEGLAEVPLWLIAIDPENLATDETIKSFYHEVWELGEWDRLVQRALKGYAK